MGISLGGSTPYIPPNQRAEIMAQLQQGITNAQNNANQGSTQISANLTNAPNPGTLLNAPGANLASQAGAVVGAGALSAAITSNTGVGANAKTGAPTPMKFSTNQLLPSSAPTATQLPTGGSGLAPGNNATGTMAQMLQNFSNSTLTSTPTTVNTSAGPGQVLNPTTEFGAKAGGNAQIVSQNLHGNTAGVTAPAPPNANEAQVAGATQLRANHNGSGQIVATPTPATPTAVGTGEAVMLTNAQMAKNLNNSELNMQLQTNSAVTNENLAPRIAKNQNFAGPDPSLVAGMATKAPYSQEPESHLGQVGFTNPDPVTQSQQLAVSGWGAKIQNALNLELGFAGLNGGNILSAIGILILVLVAGRALVNFNFEEIVILSIAGIVGIALTIGGNILGSK